MLAWNHTASSITKVSPWEVEWGRVPPSAMGPDAPAEPDTSFRVSQDVAALGFSAEEQPEDTRSRLFQYSQSLRTARALYTEAVGRLAKLHRLENVDRLTSSVNKAFEDIPVGTKVRVYRPTISGKVPAGAQPQWDDGYEVMQRLPGGYLCKKIPTSSEKSKEVNIAFPYIRRMPAVAEGDEGYLAQPEPDLGARLLPLQEEQKHKVGDLLIIRSERAFEQDQFYWIACCTKVYPSGKAFDVHYYASRNPSVAEPRFLRAFVNTRNQLVLTTASSASAYKPWTEKVIQDEIIGTAAFDSRDLTRTGKFKHKNGARLSSDTLNLITDFAPNMQVAPLEDLYFLASDQGFSIF